jgi:hypothetical protein
MSETATEPSAPAQPDPPKDSKHRDFGDIFELLATILLAVAVVSTAWAGFQSAKWGGVQASNYSSAGAARTESVRFSTLAGQQSSVDVTTFFSWLTAVVEDIDRGDIEAPVDATQYEPTPRTLSGFTYERLRDEFRPAVGAWLDTNPFIEESAPPTPFAMDEYQLAADAESQRLLLEAQTRASVATEANQTSDNYVLTAVLFASALFLRGARDQARPSKVQDRLPLDRCARVPGDHRVCAVPANRSLSSAARCQQRMP